MQLTTQQQVDNWNRVDRVLHLDKDTYLFGGLEGNISMIFDAIEADYTRTDFLKWDIQNVHNVILKLVAQQALVQNPRYVNAFATVFSDPQFARKSGLACNESMIFHELVNRDLPCTAESVSQIVCDLWNSLADNSTYRENKADSDRRARQIAEMTQGGTTGFTVQISNQKIAFTKTGQKFDPMHGQAQGLSMGIQGPWSRGAGSKPFSEMTNQEVQVLYDAWKVSSDLRNMTREELREIVKNKSNPYGTKPTLQLPHVAAPGEQQLINTATQREFTQRELIAFLNNPNDPYAGRKLLTNPNTGRLVAWKRERFEKIIRGELG